MLSLYALFSPMFKLCFYVPENHLESVKDAVFDAGAGAVGEYDRCSWEVLGSGQFRPSINANPFIGSAGTLEKVPEYRVETVVAEQYLTAVLEALKATHPYEEPAFDVIKLEAF